MQFNRKFIISCKFFGGFEVTLDVNQYESIEEIIQYITDQLKETLSKNKLNNLVEMLNKTYHLYHIHDYEFIDILLKDDTYYIYIARTECLN